MTADTRPSRQTSQTEPRRDNMRSSTYRVAATILAAVFLFAGCDSFFEVENPTDIEAENLNDPEMIPALANTPHAAVADDYDFAVEIGALPGDGAIHSSTNQGYLRIDQGTFGTFTLGAEDVYNGLSSAQWTAREATERLRELLDNPDQDERVARGLFWDALARVTLADMYERVTFDGGEPHQPPEVYRMAIDILEQAASIGRAAGDTEIVAASEATIARAYRALYFDTGESDMSLFESAASHAQAALQADADFNMGAEYAPPGSENGLVDAMHNTHDYDVMDPDLAGMTDPASGQTEPRIQHSEQQGIGSQGDALYKQNKYTRRNQPIPVSKWEEPALILAEYNLLSGDLDGAVERINQVRSSVGLPDFSSDDADEIRDQLIYERRVEFWLELRRWQDMRYYEIVPERWTPAAKQAGVERRFPIALRECDANPNVTC